ncbi:MAG: endolytic transglycosylase MltG [Actinobacteria bacterium]|nr:endolytic transglycosylase MltG [Actinomycetota bacterium]
MAEQPTEIRRVPPAPRRRRPRAPRSRIIARRLVALAFILGLFVLMIGSALALIGGDGDEKATPTTPVAAAPKPLRIIFPEGFTREQMARRIGEVNKIAKDKRKVTSRLSPERYRALTAGAALMPPKFEAESPPPHLEGFLFPATYEFNGKTTTRQLVDTQLAAFRKHWGRVNLNYARSRNLTPYDVLIIASMVEKEVVAPEERPLVAAVIYNRLKAGMTLGIDATIRYGLNVPATESLRVSQLEDPNPYNTRIHSGLPPTPIASPGLASMQAAAHPAKVDYLFFVRKPDKVHHFFTNSQREFDNYANANGY